MRYPKRYSLIAWLVIMTSNFFLLYQFVIQSSISAMISDLMRDFDIDITDIATLSSSYFWSYVICQIPAGLLIDRIGPRKVMIISVGLSSILAFIFSNAESAEIAQWSRFAMGITCAPAMSSCIYLAARWLPKETFPLAVGVIEMTGMVGGAIGEVTLARLVSDAGWRYSYFLCASVCGVLCILSWITIYDMPKHSSFFDDSFHKKEKKIMNSFLKLLKSPQIWMIATYGGLIFAILNGFASLWAIPFMIQQYHYDNTSAVTMASLLFVGAAIGAPISGYLLNRVKIKKLLIVEASFSLLLLGIIIYFPVLAAPCLPVLLILCGISSSAYVLPFALIKELSPIEAQGAAVGFTNMFSILFGSILFQPLTAHIIDFIHPGKTRIQDISLIHLEDFRIALMPFVIGVLIALILSCFVRNRPIHKQ